MSTQLLWLIVSVNSMTSALNAMKYDSLSHEQDFVIIYAEDIAHEEAAEEPEEQEQSEARHLLKQEFNEALRERKREHGNRDFPDLKHSSVYHTSGDTVITLDYSPFHRFSYMQQLKEYMAQHKAFVLYTMSILGSAGLATGLIYCLQ